MDATGVVDSGQSLLKPNEFRLKLQFKPSVGPAARVYTFYKEWLEATNSIINEFSAHICKGLSVEIRLVEMKEGSTDPKFELRPRLVGDQGTVEINPKLLDEFIPHVQDFINANTDHLMESVGDVNYNEFFLGKLAEISELKKKFSKMLSPMASEPDTLSINEEPPATPVIDDKVKVPEDKIKGVKYDKKRVFNALSQIATSTSSNLLSGEKLTQISPDEVIDVTPELIRSSRALERDEEIVTETPYERQTLIATRAVLIGDGVWSFKWGSKSKRMTIRDEEWLNLFHAGAVALIAKQELTADVLEVETKFYKMGICYKRKFKHYVDKIYER